MIALRAASHRVRICAVASVIGQDSPSRSTDASPLRCRGADLQVSELGDAAASVGDQPGDGGGPQRRQGVGVDGPAHGQVVQQALGVAGGEPEAEGWPLAVNAPGEAGECREGVEGVNPDAHRVGIGRGLGAAKRVADAGLSRAGVGEPCVGAGGFQELAHGHLRPLGGPQRVPEVLVKEPPAEPPGAGGETAVVQ